MSKGKRIVAGCVSAVLLAGWTSSLHAQAPAPQVKPAALVNGEGIPATDLAKLLEKEPPAVHPLTEAQKAEMRKIALDMLIDDVLMRQFVRKNALPISAAELNKEMAELVEVLGKQKRTLQDFLKDTGQTEDTLRADIAARLQWKAYLTARLPDQAVKAYYDANKVFFDKVFVRASHILLRVAPNASEADRQAVRGRLVALRQDIVSGKIAFDQAAKTYSDCPSKVNGGDIGHFPYKFAVQEPFAKAAFALEVGGVSDVVQTDFGYHILKVTDRTKAEPSNFEAIKDGVRDVYAQELELYQTVIAEQRKTAHIEIAPQ